MYDTLDLIIRKHDRSMYEWHVVSGRDEIDGGVEEDIKTCLKGAGDCFEMTTPIRLAVTYGGTQVGTYSPGRLQIEPDEVADGIMLMLEH